MTVNFRSAAVQTTSIADNHWSSSVGRGHSKKSCCENDPDQINKQQAKQKKQQKFLIQWSKEFLP
ncbi:hypothetical protein T11_1485 [Trichinella zimbabwensis]|uniref:Uncharacterized protein n=1 Tax=Trichinella zimbabwensis TaxID=268475 RepID=A0A0V1H2Z4_9BILA|nr:hypothetical protein T11_1485 [Trichinella zimbabwensis]